ncbi:hypothetical protein OAD67_02775 [bacterium]|nr:hypothetical protein [bacterium]
MSKNSQNALHLELLPQEKEGLADDSSYPETLCDAGNARLRRIGSYGGCDGLLEDYNRTYLGQHGRVDSENLRLSGGGWGWRGRTSALMVMMRGIIAKTGASSIDGAQSAATRGVDSDATSVR